MQRSSFGMRVSGQCLSGLFIFGAVVFGQVNVLTQHNDIGRTGQNLNETILTPTNVTSGNFGKLFSVTVDGQVYAQPLYMTGLAITGQGTHNVTFVASMHDTVYAFDADAAGAPLWQVSFLDAAHGAAPGATTDPVTDTGCTETEGTEVGITGTPVIDPSTGTLYVIGKTLENGYPVQRLHALDITTGNEKPSSPVTLSASVHGTGNGSSGGILNFDPKWENQRPGLLLVNGIVYVAFGSYCDAGPFHGWVLAYNTRSMTQTSVFIATPNALGSGIWLSGAGLAADIPTGRPFGRMFLPTGNGTYDASVPYQTNTVDYGDDVLRLDLNNGVMTVSDAFTPMDQANMEANDLDLASGGVMLLPDQAVSGHTHQLLAAGKTGNIYLVDRDVLGGYSTTANNIIESLVPNQVGGVFGSPAYWNNHVYYWGDEDTLKQFDFLYNNGLMDYYHNHNSAESQSFPGSTPSVSANGTTNGIVWNVDSSAWITHGNATLLAHDALNVSTTLYSSATNPTRDSAGPAVQFAVPTISNGKVYVATYGQLNVYGLLTSDFTLSAAQPGVTLAPSGSVTDIITVGTQNGFSGNVSLAASSLPAGVTSAFAAGSTTGTTVATFSASGSAASGTYPVLITGTSGSLTHSLTLTVTVSVTSVPSFGLSASPAALMISQGSAAASTITVIPANGFSSPVGLSVAGLPAGVTATIGTVSASAVPLTFAVSTAASAGTYTAIITGTSGTLSAMTSVALTVAAQPSFGLTVNPASSTLLAGNSGNFAIGVAPLNGFNGAIAFSVSGLPAGVTSAFAPASSSTGTTLTLSAGANTLAGNYTLVVSGVSGRLAASASITLTIASPSGFAASLSSSSITLQRYFFFGYGSAADTVNISALNGFRGTVQLSVSGLSPNLSASFSPSSLSNSGSSRLTISPGRFLSRGTYTLTINATSNSVTHSVTLTVVAP